MSTLTRPQAAEIEVVRAARRAPRRHHRAVVAGLGAALLAVLAARLLLGDFTVSAVDLVRILAGEQIPGASYIVTEVRLPRAALAVLCGTAFGLGGALFQATLRNPLASPDIVGVSMGASAAAVCAIVVLGLAGLSVSMAAVAGALATAVLVRGTSGSDSRGASYRLVLVGVATAALLHAVVQYLFTRADTYDAQLMLRWLTGSVSAADWSTVRILALLLVLLAPGLLWAGRALPVLELGHDAARGLGRRRHSAELVLLLGVALVAAGVAAAGPIAFVAFVSGPLARALNHGRTTLPGAALVGAVVVVAADFAADQLLPGANYPVGVVTGAVGAPVLLWMLTRRKLG